MARINIEEEAWVRIYRLADTLGISVREAVGTVACLWHQSQDLVKSAGTINEILDWASLTKISDVEKQNWISALEKSRFLLRLNDEHFEIRGNAIQIESRISRIDRSRKGAKALMKKVRQVKALEAGLRQAPSRVEPGLKALNSGQFNAIQGNSIQCNSGQGILISKNKNSSNSQKASAFVAAYCSRFKNRWGHNPEILGKEAGIAKRLAKTLSLEKFEIYLDAYFAMPDAWLGKTKHPLASFETKLNEIVAFANNGTFTTSKQVAQADEFASNMLLLQQVREGKL
jgi:hypothetical protein